MVGCCGGEKRSQENTFRGINDNRCVTDSRNKVCHDSDESPMVVGICCVPQRSQENTFRGNDGGQGRSQEKTFRGNDGGQGRSQEKTFRESNKKRCVTDSHNEEVCHGTGERRRDLMDQLKIFLEEFDERPCGGTPRERGPGGLKPLGQYPDYLKKHCQSWTPGPPAPLITSVQTHEIRPTEDYENKRHENSEYITYVDARLKPPPSSCNCAKRNGLQDQCPRPECTPPTPQCLATNPGPCCPPSLGLTRAEAARGLGPSGSTGARQTPQEEHSPHTRQQGFVTNAPAGAGSKAKMVCFCRASPSGMPSGQKYICCPAPFPSY